MFLVTCSHVDVAKRTKVVNEKLSNCLEVMGDDSDVHNRKIVIEVLHFIQRKLDLLHVLHLTGYVPRWLYTSEIEFFCELSLA